MSKTTFNSKHAADLSQDDFAEGELNQYGFSEGELPPIPGLAEHARAHGFDLSEFDLSGVDKDPVGRPAIIETNSLDTIARRNRYKRDSFGAEDRSKPTGPFYVPKAGLKLDDMIPEMPAEERKRRSTLEYQRSKPIASNHEATKAITAAIGLVPTLTEHAHEDCGGTGLVSKDGNLSPCKKCEGRGHIVFDTTMGTGRQGGTGEDSGLIIPGGHADLAYSIGAQNYSIQAHNFFCTGERCYDGCPIEPYVRHIREGQRSKGHTVKDWDIKFQTGRNSAENGYSEGLRRSLAYTSLEDLWEPTAPGLRARSATNNLEGAATNNIRVGDIVGFHGGFDPGATMLVHSINADGSINGFRHSLDFDSAQAEREERNSRSRGMDVNGRPGLTQELMHDDPSDSFSATKLSGDHAWKNDERASLIDLYGRRLITASDPSTRRTSTHTTIVDRKPTDLKWVESVHPHTVSRLNPIIEPHLQYRGHIYQTLPFGDIRDHEGNRLLQRTGEPYADSTYASNIRAVRVVRGRNAWSQSSLDASFANMVNADHKRKLHGLLTAINRDNGIGSGSYNSDSTNFDHPLNVVPRSAAASSTAWVRSDSGTLIVPSDIRRSNTERTKSELSDKAKDLGILGNLGDVKVDAPASPSNVASMLLSPEHEKHLRSAIDARITTGTPMTDEQFQTAKTVFATTKSFDEAHKAVEPSAYGQYDIGEDARNIEDRA